jgi:hypothetical protein
MTAILAFFMLGGAEGFCITFYMECTPRVGTDLQFIRSTAESHAEPGQLCH